MAIAMMTQGCPYAHEAMITLVNGTHQAPRCSIKGDNKNRIIATIEVRKCEGFRTTAHRDSGAGTGAVVGKRPGKEPAGR